jgi:ribosome-binding factor A
MAKSSERASRGFGRDAGIRGARLEQLFREELNYLLESEIGDAALQSARVSRVELGRDAARARVWFVLLESEASVAAVTQRLQRAAGFMRYRLCEALPVKRMPELSFCWDANRVHAREDEGLPDVD